LTPKCVASRNAGRLGAAHERLHNTSGGSSETELNEFPVRP
jgi:hypothetical protein